MKRFHSHPTTVKLLWVAVIYKKQLLTGRMRFRALFGLFIVLITAMYADAQTLLGQEHSPTKILGTATNYLQPCLLIERNDSDWNIEINYIAQTNFSKHAWLKPLGRTESILQLWTTNNVEIPPVNTNVLAAMQFPEQTSVSSIIRSVRPSDRRGLQWLWTEPGMLSGAAGFSLIPSFGRVFTNDVVLQITPLIYKVESNEVKADLVKFHPVRVGLMANGNVQEVEH